MPSKRRNLSFALIGGTAAAALGVYLLFWFSPLAMLFSDTPDLPTDGIVAVASGDEDMITGDDRIVGDLGLGDGCATVTHDGVPVVLVFRSGAADVNDDLTELRWKDKTYLEGSPIAVTGELVDSLRRLDRSHDYFMPGGCPQFDRAILVDHLPEG